MRVMFYLFIYVFIYTKAINLMMMMKSHASDVFVTRDLDL